MLSLAESMTEGIERWIVRAALKFIFSSLHSCFSIKASERLQCFSDSLC
jgi:hypothetical protein